MQQTATFTLNNQVNRRISSPGRAFERLTKNDKFMYINKVATSLEDTLIAQR